ncbi:SDR family NAD(P)-dependent oxidoreductase [Altererythrobacter aurantiacus]|uniref:SDR family NAD(P)-dependent oxidoreductase n=1 Tax=Parapontixanthobacter aurantiacus TaxID=1463599 RepID=A0A844ZAV1_9SPHN|nr:SDR family oxidoreductase [Parapontixanthobacter aurantiacus]MXO84432.1 SDR family NAD(P)-dependent oxidoreductase [Parapontixanthobacter aurantiacus]
MRNQLNLKPLNKQVLVITGATSGHGLCTTQMAAKQGAKVMLAARDEKALAEVCEDIRRQGGTADYVATDVSVEAEVQRLADQTIERFGGFDTWVNNAGIGVYSQVLDLDIDDHRKVFETNYWGVVYGSTIAARHLKDKPGGGALINIGSINSDIPSPILASYNASKHAVKGFTDSFRIELQMNEQPVSVTLIQPSAIGTPFPQHARNTTGYEARLPKPIYAPEVVARAILDAAEHQRRDVVVGGAGKFQILGAGVLPRVFDKIATTMADKLVDRSQPIQDREGNLYDPQGNDGDVEGRQHGRHFSVTTAVGRHPWTVAGALLSLVAAGLWATKEARWRS